MPQPYLLQFVWLEYSLYKLLACWTNGYSTMSHAILHLHMQLFPCSKNVNFIHFSLWNTTWNGKNPPIVEDDIDLITYRLSSTPCTSTCLEPFCSHVWAPQVGTRCIPIWLVWTNNSGGMEWAFTRYATLCAIFNPCPFQLLGSLLAALVAAK